MKRFFHLVSGQSQKLRRGFVIKAEQNAQYEATASGRGEQR